MILFPVSFLSVLVLLQADSPPGAGAVSAVEFRAVSAGGFHTCAIDATGAAHCWGLNLWGQLGSGSVSSEVARIPIFGPDAYGPPGLAGVNHPTALETDLRFRQIAAGDRHTCGLTVDGLIYCWGYGAWGQLGNGTREHSARPVRVPGDREFRAVTAGGTHSCGLTTAGALYCWGGNWHGQLGIGERIEVAAEPRRVAPDLRFLAVSAGGIHTCGIDESGDAYCWGDRRDGRLGTGVDEAQDRWQPVRVTGDHKLVGIDAGGAHTCATTRAGEGLCWGHDGAGQVTGRPRMAVTLEPRAVPIRGQLKAVTAGARETCAITIEGLMYCWGSGRDVELGDPGGGEPQPFRVTIDAPLVHVSAGGNFFPHACAVTAAGKIYCWGDNSRGQLGDGSFAARDTPTAVAP